MFKKRRLQNTCDLGRTEPEMCIRRFSAGNHSSNTHPAKRMGYAISNLDSSAHETKTDLHDRTPDNGVATLQTNLALVGQ